MSNELISSSHAKAQCVYHLEWCPKYRYCMFRQEKYKNLCETLIQEVAKRHGIEVLELFVMPDHVHLVARLPITMSPSSAFMLLKGGSSYLLNKAQPKFRLRYPQGHFWSPGKFARTVGDVDLETTRLYVRNQMDIAQQKLEAYV